MKIFAAQLPFRAIVEPFRFKFAIDRKGGNRTNAPPREEQNTRKAVLEGKTGSRFLAPMRLVQEVLAIMQMQF